MYTASRTKAARPLSNLCIQGAVVGRRFGEPPRGTLRDYQLSFAIPLVLVLKHNLRFGEKMKAISIYTGAGGLDVGFHAAGLQIVAAAELDGAACQTFHANFPETRLFQGTVIDALYANFFNVKADVLIGGPPCQGFSVAGKMDPSDPRSAEIFRYLDVLRYVQPKAFVMENVKALAKLSKWEFVREKIAHEAKRAGYELRMIVLNSAEYGVPQKRERVFFVGISADQFGSAAAHSALDSMLSKIETFKTEPKTIGEIVQSLGPAGSQGNPRICNAKVMFAANPIMRRSPYAGMLFNGAGRPISSSGVSSTLPASMGGNKTPIVDEAEIFESKSSYVESYHSHLMAGGKPRKGQAPKRLRRLTVDECIAIQSFPSDYCFEGSQSAVFKQIGNAVPPLLAKAVGESLASELSVLASIVPKKAMKIPKIR